MYHFFFLLLKPHVFKNLCLFQGHKDNVFFQMLYCFTFHIYNLSFDFFIWFDVKIHLLFPHMGIYLIDLVQFIEKNVPSSLHCNVILDINQGQYNVCICWLHFASFTICLLLSLLLLLYNKSWYPIVKILQFCYSRLS